MNRRETPKARWAAALALALASCLLGATAADASGGDGTVAAQAALQREPAVVEDCDYDTFTCFHDYAGVAGILGAPGPWAFTARLGHLVFPACRTSSGTWVLANGQGDSLTGTISNAVGSVRMSVTGGTGRYAGATAPEQDQPGFGIVDPPIGGCPANPNGYQGRIALTLAP